MWQMQKIFVALDGSPECEGALELAEGVAATGPAELVLVTVIPSFRVVPSHDVIALTDFASAAGQAKHYLNEQASRLSDQFPGLRVRTLVKLSPLSAADMGAELMYLAAEESCNVVILTAGSEAARGVVADQGVAILLVPPAPQPRPPGRSTRVPRIGLLPRPNRLPRPRLAPASLFFFGGPEGSVLLCQARPGDEGRKR